MRIPKPVASRFGREAEDEIGLILDYLNGAHRDAVRYLATALTGVQTPNRARLSHADPKGLIVSTVDGPRRLAFSGQPSTGAEVFLEVVGWLRRARSLVPDAPITSLEDELANEADQVPARGFVTRRAQLAPELWQLEMELQGELAITGPDAFFMMLVPDRSESWLRAPLQRSGVQALVNAGSAQFAFYAVRSLDRKKRCLRIWLAEHQRPGCTRWLLNADAGAEVALFGTRHGFRPPVSARRFVLMGDPTAYGALASILDAVPREAPCTVLVSGSSRAAASRLPLRPRDAMCFTPTRDGEAGPALLERLRETELGPDSYVYAGGERRAVHKWRRYLRYACELPAEQMAMMSYWRR